MKQQRLSKKSDKPQLQVVDNRTPKPAEDLPANARVVHYIEVKDADQRNIMLMLAEINKRYNGNSHDQHFLIPVRHGKIGTDIEFEAEFLNTVHKVCEIKDGEIVLKGGAHDIKVTRNSI